MKQPPPEPPIIWNSPLMRWVPADVEAMAINGEIHVRGDAMSPALYHHERDHALRQIEDGWWRWLARYVWWALTLGRAKHPDEIRADRASREAMLDAHRSIATQTDLDTIAEALAAARARGSSLKPQGSISLS